MTISYSVNLYAQPHFELAGGVSTVFGKLSSEDAPRLDCSFGFGYSINCSQRFSVDPVLKLSLQGKKDCGVLNLNLPIYLSLRFNRVDFGFGPFVGRSLYDGRPSGLVDDVLANGAHSRLFYFECYKKFDFGISTRVRYAFSRYYLGLEYTQGLRNLCHDYITEYSGIQGLSSSINVFIGIELFHNP